MRNEPASEIMHQQEMLIGVPRSVGDFFTWGPVMTDSVSKVATVELIDLLYAQHVYMVALPPLLLLFLICAAKRHRLATCQVAVQHGVTF